MKSKNKIFPPKLNFYGKKGLTKNSSDYDLQAVAIADNQKIHLHFHQF